jgi:hypothetical protein
MFKIRHNIIKRFCQHNTLINLNKNNKTLIKKEDDIKDKLNTINKKIDSLKDMQEWSFVLVTTSWVNIIILLISRN